ncbi:MAG TPA: hypothetical protein PKE69_10480, partial [Pyrinomonadaceae bacterium]|nr:hypothetical protein [Pyrinomonadaceae bacterium]
MICQNCHEKVDNDLIFCTNCGERISGIESAEQTVLKNDSQVTKNSPENTAKTSSNIKWIALIVALLAIPASIFGVYLLMNPNKPQIPQNPAKTNSVAKTPTGKTNSTTNSNLDNFHKNFNADNSNTNQSNTETPVKEVEIINER